MITLSKVKNDPLVKALINASDSYLKRLGYTEHGLRHASLCTDLAQSIATKLGFSNEDIELVGIAAYLHDIGNVTGRKFHAQNAAIMAMEILKNLNATPDEITTVMGAIGNHDEIEGVVADPLTSILILADKSDVHRSRVRSTSLILFDIHDRVNYAVKSSFLRVDPLSRQITLELVIDTEISKVMEYFEIFLERMTMCRKAAQSLNCDFHLVINETTLL